MRILLISHIFPPAIDGGSQVIYKFGEYLKSQGHTIKVVTSNCYSTDDFTQLKYSKITDYGLPITDYKIYRLPVITFLHRPLKLISKVLSKGPIFSPLPFIQSLISILKYKPDLIVAGPLPTTIAIYAHFYKLVTPNCKLIINASFHPTDLDFHQPILIKCLQSTNYLWTLTDFETNYFYRHFLIPYSKMINVGNGVDATLIKASPRYRLPITNYRLLFIGSFAAHKKIEVLLSAYKLLPQSYHLTIAGKPTLHRIDFPSNITLIKNLHTKNLAKLLDQNDILISPSIQESFGLVLLEAMARGLPVIAANIPASTEIVKKSKAGLLFNQNDPQHLVKQIRYLENHPKVFYQLSQNALIYAKLHTWDKIGQQLCQKIFSSSG